MSPSMVTWKTSLLKTVFDKKRLVLLFPKCKSNCQKCVSVNVHLYQAHLSAGLIKEISASQMKKLECGQCEIPDISLGVAVYEQNSLSC